MGARRSRVTTVWAMIYLILLVGKAACVRIVLARNRRVIVDMKNPPRCMPLDVTVITPILSGDPMLPRVLESNVKALATVAFRWLVDADDARGQEIVDAVKRDNPTRDISIVRCDAAPDGVNPKTFKLDAVFSCITSEVVVILDDDAQLSAAALDTLLDGLQIGDLVTALPFYRESATVGGQLMSQFVNNNAAMTYLPPTLFAAPLTVNGMCYGTRTSYLRELGGFAPMLRYLTDDLAIAQHVRSHGGSLVQTTAPVSMQTTVASITRYRQQMHRWFVFATLLVRGEALAMQLCIAVVLCAPPVVFWLLLIATVATPSFASIAVLVSVVFCRALILRALQRQQTGAARHHPFWSVVSELAQPLHLLHALFDRTIVWRSKRYHVTANDEFFLT
jgi:ceramide glucosyltransferase